MRVVDAGTSLPSALVADGCFSGFQTRKGHNPEIFWGDCPGISVANEFRTDVAAYAQATPEGTPFPQIPRLSVGRLVTSAVLVGVQARLWTPTNLCTWLAHKLDVHKEGGKELHVPQSGKLEGNLFVVVVGDKKIIVRLIFAASLWKIRPWSNAAVEWSPGNKFAPGPPSSE